MNTIKKNVIYSSILTVSAYLFPLMTFPYVTRVLGVNNIGICNFVDSIIQYFIFFSMMGISTIGIREIARTKGNKQELSKTFNSLLILNLCATIVAIMVLLLCVLFIPQFQEYKSMFYIGAAKVLANTLLVEWFFKGLEDFKYITVRSIIIRAIYVIFVFVLVKSQEDYIIYFFLTSFMVVVNAIVNVWYCRYFIKYSLRDIDLRPFIKPFFILGSYMILTSLYTTFNVAFLGFAKSPEEVGYYTTATKLFTLILSFYGAFTGVMIPRMSILLSEGKINEFKRLTNKSIELLFAFVVPIIITTDFCAPIIIKIIAGEGFEGAILPMRIIMPLMLITGLEQILVLQMLSPLKKDTAILRNSIIGAIVALLCNILIVPIYASVGTAFVWIMSEVAVMFSAQYYVRRYIDYKIPTKTIIYRICLVTPFVLCIFPLYKYIVSPFWSLIIIGSITIVGWTMIEYYVLGNVLLRDNLNMIISKLKRPI